MELLWGLGMPVVIESTFLQLFLRNLGASSFLVGLLPTLLSAGVALFSLSSYSLTVRLARKRGAIIAVHVAAALPVLAFGLLLGAAGIRPSTLALFLAAYSLFSIAVGLILPAWQNYLVKIFSAARSIRAMALMMIMQSAAKLAGSLWLVRMVERYSFSATGSSLVFTLVGPAVPGGQLLLPAHGGGARDAGAAGRGPAPGQPPFPRGGGTGDSCCCWAPTWNTGPWAGSSPSTPTSPRSTAASRPRWPPGSSWPSPTWGGCWPTPCWAGPTCWR